MAEEANNEISGEKLELIQRILELQNTLHGIQIIILLPRIVNFAIDIYNIRTELQTYNI